MVALTERQIRQKLVSEFMSYDLLTIDLQRPIMSETSAGGVIQTGTLEIIDQQFYFVPFKRRLTQEMTRNPQSYGEDFARDIEYILIFIPDQTDVKEGDLFSVVENGYLASGDYRVSFLSKRTWDRQQAVVKLRD